MDIVSHKSYKKFSFYLLAVLLLIVLFIKLVSLRPGWIERYYSTGIYLWLAQFFRVLFGWLPFSIGDILYTAAGFYLLVRIVVNIRALILKRITKLLFIKSAVRTLLIASLVYICFNLFWGLNYNRLGIAYQLNITPAEHTKADLQKITTLLIKRVNDSRKKLDSNIRYPSFSEIFRKSNIAYQFAEKRFPFLHYGNRSIKKSLYGRGGNYLGFFGYYNPFTGESQLNLTQPRFLLPYVTCHEMAHQLGYASESEANFVGYLSAISSPDILFHYSVYFELFNYANHELFIRDSITAKANYKLLDTLVKVDFKALKAFHKKYKNPFAPIIQSFYDQYLKVNQQDKGIESYNYVVGLLIAFQKKFGYI